MRLVIGSDHAGFPLKAAVVDHIKSLGHEVTDVGSFDEKPVDFPEIAKKVTTAVNDGSAERGPDEHLPVPTGEGWWGEGRMGEGW